MLPNIQAVYISNGGEYHGWLDLNRFLASPEPIDHWQVLYCLMFCGRLVFQDIHFQCTDPLRLRGWLEQWLKTPVGRKLKQSYVQNFKVPGAPAIQLTCMVVPDQREIWLF